MIGSRYHIAICESFMAGENMADISRKLGISYVYVKKIVRDMVDNGILVHNPPYTVRADYKEVLTNAQKS